MIIYCHLRKDYIERKNSQNFEIHKGSGPGLFGKYKCYYDFFSNFPGKHLCLCLFFNKVQFAGLQPYYKSDSSVWLRVFYRTVFFIEYLRTAAFEVRLTDCKLLNIQAVLHVLSDNCFCKEC